MTEEQILLEFSKAVLEVLRDQRDLGADALGEIANRAVDLGLGAVDSGGYFVPYAIREDLSNDTEQN